LAYRYILLGDFLVPLDGVFLPSLLLVEVFPDALLVKEQFVTFFDMFKLVEEILMLKYET
jgi:hypothetical protein